MDGKMSLIALVILTMLAWLGVRHLSEHWVEWCRHICWTWNRYTAGPGVGLTTLRTRLAARAIEPVLFTGFFVMTLIAWVLVMLAAGLGPILTALSIAFPGAAIAYHAALIATRFCRRHMERG